MVAGRQVHLVLQRQIGRVQADDRSAGRFDAATRDRAAEPDALLHAVLVSRFEEAPLHGHEPQRVGAGRRERAAEKSRQRSLDGATAHAESRVESGFEMGRVLEPAEVDVPRDLRQQRRDRRDETDHGRPCGRDVPRMGCRRQVSMVPRVHRLRPALAVARHDVVRPQRDVRVVLRRPEERGREPAPAGKR
jgi:hypothetical protein